MGSYVPKVAAIHDLSCFGRCSLTVIAPVLACMGIQVCPLPTAVLSTHLGGFKDIAFVDFTDNISSFSRHWQQERLAFDCLYSGFLASEHQIEVVSETLRAFSQNKPLVLIDPVMGDEGKLYSVYNSQMQQAMRQLISQADVITPNYTEACFLLDKEYQEQIVHIEELRDWLEGLSHFGPNMVVITGIPRSDGQITNLGYEKKTGVSFEITHRHIPVRYPGTGDIFASVLAGCLLKGSGLYDAMQQASQFVSLAIQTTYEANTPQREGVLLERVLSALLK